MKKIFLAWAFLLSFCLTGNTQKTEEQLNWLIDRFFVSLQTHDTVLLNSLTTKNFSLFSVEKGTTIKTRKITKNELMTILSNDKNTNESWVEKLENYSYFIDEILATVWTEYSLYSNDTLIHTGVNQFTFILDDSGSWKLNDITDSRYSKSKGDLKRKDYLATESKIIDSLMNNWHKAASDAKADNFFSFMSDSCIYKGTDKTERWTKKEFYDFAKPFFDKGKAWDFKPLERFIQFDDNLQTAWFDEKLDTWMGICKASGILQKENGEWKLMLYDLSVTIDNGKIKDFIELSK